MFDGDLGDEVLHVLIQLPETELLRVIRENRKSAHAKQLIARELRLEKEENAREAKLSLKRKRDWEDLNDALLNGQSTEKKSRSFSSVKDKEMPKRYQPVKVKSGEFYDLLATAPAIKESALDGLVRAIKIKNNVYNDSISGDKTNEATRSQFLSCVFEHVIHLYQQEQGPDMSLGVQVELIGDQVKANASANT